MAVLRVRKFWYETILGLQRFLVAVSRVVVNHDCRGGTAPDALVWDNGEGEVSSIVRRRPGSTLSMLPWIQARKFGISNVDVLCMREDGCGYRLLNETEAHKFKGRPMTPISAVRVFLGG